ncbi:DUF6895 family protein [Burkholderia ubonensis]|uniref:DUF6895 domain-containing protein n=1 Tax=Burkholderia ubonensis subsp. mesacidophila TaxID=265293 RepID=A0A2A4FCA1_9BURK|nr:hypothetical protein [Burkholderia ubonensis]PCE30627.1 hypothetical protein BZL54_19860 [Burkholderia ubonensis subsp. mesacidophila]
MTDRLDSPDLVGRVLNALHIATQMLASIEEARPSHGDDPGTPGFQATYRDKIVAESAMLVLCAKGAANHDRRISECVDAVIGPINRFARSAHVASALCVDPGRALEHAVAHIILGRLGYPDATLDHLLSLCHAGGAVVGPERLPHRQLEQQWLARLWGVAHRPDRGERSLLVQSMLGRALDAFGSSRLDVYAFTHALMYATDFGDRRPRLPRKLSAIVLDAETALAFALDTDDLDLAAEVLLTWPMLGLPWSPAAVFAFRRLTAVADERGFLPGYNFVAAEYDKLTGDEQGQYALVTSYHANYVMGFLCSLALRRGGTPTDSVSADQRYRGAAAALIDLVDDAAETLSWRRQFDALTPDEQDRVSPLLLATLLRRAKNGGDLRLVQHALAVAVKYDLCCSPSAVQAAALLRRGQFLVHSFSDRATERGSAMDVAVE